MISDEIISKWLTLELRVSLHLLPPGHPLIKEAALCPSQLTSNSLTSGHLPHPPVHTEHEVDCVQRQGITTIMLAIREECEVLVALDLDRRDIEEWTDLLLHHSR